MAIYFSNLPVDMANPNFHRITSGIYNYEFRDNINFESYGFYFEDVLIINWSESGSFFQTNFFGKNLTQDRFGNINSGTLEALESFYWDGLKWLPAEGLVEISLPAAIVFGTFITSTNIDDLRLVVSPAFSGADTIVGSPFDDILVGYGGNDNVRGEGGNDNLRGEEGSDILNGGAGSDFLVGGPGIDTATYEGIRSSYRVSGSAEGTLSVRALVGSEGTDTLQSVERLQFSNGVLAFDLSGNAGQAYRLYQAAFARTPDTPGLKYQTNALDTVLNLWQVAGNFIASPEFQSMYGSPATVTDARFVTLLYNNVLGSVPN